MKVDIRDQHTLLLHLWVSWKSARGRPALFLRVFMKLQFFVYRETIYLQNKTLTNYANYVADYTKRNFFFRYMLSNVIKTTGIIR